MVEFTLQQYFSMWTAIEEFRKQKGRLPNYVDIYGYRILKGAYNDAYKRVVAFKKANGRFPNTVSINGVSLIASTSYQSDKTAFLKALAAAIGGKFNTLTECYNLIRANETYKFEIGDTAKQAKAIENLKYNVGNNCVNYAQLMKQAADELGGYESDFVRTYCVKSKVGHVYIRARGRELGNSWVNVDAAAGASAGSKYQIGKAWCQDYPDKIYNQEYLFKDKY